MKFKVKVVVGVDFPGLGISKKNKEFTVEAATLEDVMAAAVTEYRKVFQQEPGDFASWQLSISLAGVEVEPAPAA